MLNDLVARALAYLFRRYLSIIVITISNTGFFYHHFSPKACAHYAYVAPVFKGTVLASRAPTPSGPQRLTSLPVFQVMVSHAILGVRYVLTIQSHVAEFDNVLQGV